jgi:hypothetical protein
MDRVLSFDSAETVRAGPTAAIALNADATKLSRDLKAAEGRLRKQQLDGKQQLEAEPAGRKPGLCRYLAKGVCSRGASCRFSHDATAAGGDRAPPTGEATTTTPRAGVRAAARTPAAATRTSSSSRTSRPSRTASRRSP